MRISLLVLICVLSATGTSVAQFWSAHAPPDPSRAAVGIVPLPLSSAAGMVALERAAAAGDRRASALLGVLLQDHPEIEGNPIKSALHLQVAIDAGCSDLEALSAQAVARLTSEQRAEYDAALPHWVPEAGQHAVAGITGRCLTW